MERRPLYNPLAEQEAQQRRASLGSAILNGLLVAAALLFFAASYYLRILPLKYFAVIALLAVLLLVAGFLFRSRVGKIVILVLILLLSSGMFYVQSQINALIVNRENETVISVFLVKNESPMQQLSDLNGQDIGFSVQKAESVKDQVQLQLLGAGIQARTYQEAKDNVLLLTALLDDRLPVIVLDEGIYNGFSNQTESGIEKTRVLYRMESVVQKGGARDEAGNPISMFGTGETLPERIRQKPTSAKMGNVSADAFLVLVSGIDTSGSVSTRSRSDVNILIAVNPSTNRIVTASIARDTYVPLDGEGGPLDKLTHTGIYGIETTMRTLDNYLNIDIDYYVRVNFTSFLRMIDVVGDIDVESHYDFIGHSGTHFYEGMNTLNAQTALEFVRTRYDLPGGDITRGLHQQEVIKAIIRKMTRPENLTHISRRVDAVAASVDTNVQNLVNQLISKQLADGKGWQIESMVLDGDGDEQPTYSYGSATSWVYWGTDESRQAIHDAIMACLVGQ